MSVLVECRVLFAHYDLSLVILGAAVVYVVLYKVLFAYL